MKTYKELNKDINKIIDKYNSKYFNRYDVIMQVKAELEEYYKCNHDQIEKDALLKKHKVLSSDRVVTNSNLAALFYGFLGSFIFQAIIESENFKNESGYVMLACGFILGIMIAVLACYIAKQVNNRVYNFKSVYIDEYHAKIIEKYLFEDSNGNVKKVGKRNKTKLKMIKCRRNTRRMRKTR